MTTQTAPNKPTTTPASKPLTIAERRAWIWASGRVHSRFRAACYYLFPRALTEDEDDPLTDEDADIEKYGVRETFDYLYRHANIERTPHGFWAVGHSADDTRLVFEDMHKAAAYSEALRCIYLAADSGVCIDCSADLTAEPQPKVKAEPDLKLVPPPTRPGRMD
jgi:hypothetical protein